MSYKLKVILLILLPLLWRGFGAKAFAQIVTPYSVSVSPSTICAGGTATVTLSNSQTSVFYGLVNYPITSTLTIGSPKAGTTGNSLTFITNPLNTAGTHSFAIVGVSSSDTALMNNTVTVTVNPLPTATITVSSPTICITTSATITASSSNPNNSYSLTPGGTFFSSITVTPTVTTHYILMVKDDLTTCVNTSTITIVVLTGPANVSWNPPPICVSEPPIHLRNLLGSGALHGGTWTTTGGSLSGDSVLTIPSAGTSFVLTYAAGMGSCRDSLSDTLKVNPLPPITVNSATVCAGATATLSAGGANTYTWSTGAIGSSIFPLPTANTNYTVTGISVFGCVNTATTSITVHALPTININSAVICAGNTATLTASGTVTSYTWNTNATTPSIVITPTTTTQYTVTGTGTHNCTAYNTTTVIVNPLPIVTVNSDSICTGDSTILLAQGAGTYTWVPSIGLNNTADSSVIATPTASTIYTVVGTNSFNCKNTAQSSVTVLAANSAYCSDTSISVNGAIQIHNAFSPNNDGLNDLFIIDNIGEYAANHVYIYNRWGQLLWNKSGYNNTSAVWDGKNQEGATLYAGTYFYLIENAGAKTLKGWVEITSVNK